MSRFLSLFGFKSEDKIKRVKLNTDSNSSSDDMNIITAVKSLMNDFDNGDFIGFGYLNFSYQFFGAQ